MTGSKDRKDLATIGAQTLSGSATTLIVSWPEEDPAWNLRLTLTIDEQGLRCTQFEIHPTANPPRTISSGLLRDIPIAALTRRHGEHLMKSGSPKLRALAKALARVTPEEPRSRTDQFYEEVAAVYQLARRAGQPPTTAVAKKWEVTAARAATWVRRARERGKIPPAPKQGSWRP